MTAEHFMVLATQCEEKQIFPFNHLDVFLIVLNCWLDKAHITLGSGSSDGVFRIFLESVDEWRKIIRRLIPGIMRGSR